VAALPLFFPDVVLFTPDLILGKGSGRGSPGAVLADWLDSVEPKAVSLRRFNRMGAGRARVRKRYLSETGGVSWHVVVDGGSSGR
jgi:hypothetical protein